MNKILKSAIWATAVMGFSSFAGADKKETPKEKKEPVKEVIWPAHRMQYKEVAPGVTRAVLWGDPDAGKYGALTKFALGTKHALHTHSSDISIVVISGSFIYVTEKVHTTLGPGSYLVIPGGTQHTSGTDEECLFFESGSGKFDMTPVLK